MRIFLTGATGYIGGRLAPLLLAAGHEVRCAVRDPRKLSARPWATHAACRVVPCDLLDDPGLTAAMAGCDVAYYLVHSMAVTPGSFAAQDRALAESFARSAAKAGVKRIIYLGGLGEMGEGLSEHLASRREVEQSLASASVPVTTLRAAMIIGAGSASFEILRYLVDRLPIMITPRWLSTESQPIAVRNVLRYLVDCLAVPATTGRTLDIGGPDVVSYEQLMIVMAQARGLRRRRLIKIPVLTPRLSSWWIHLVTPIDHAVARPLAEGLRNRLVCREHEATRLMPQPLLGVRAAIDAALGKLNADEVETVWSAAGPVPGDPVWSGGTTYADRRETIVNATGASVWRAVTHLGGDHGYHAGDWLWRLRGFLDRLIGGPGLRRGRRHPRELAYGEPLDFWRVSAIEDGRVLRLRAEMRLPGEAELTFEVSDAGDGTSRPRTRLVQTARFRPRGLAGIVYWFSVLPAHGFVFKGMLTGIRREAESEVDGRGLPRDGRGHKEAPDPARSVPIHQGGSPAR